MEKREFVIPHKELIALLQPDGYYRLDWQATETPPDPVQAHFQEELYRTYENDAAGALLQLGLSGEARSLSESLGFLRLIAAAFVDSLARNPDVERLREKTVVELPEETAERLLLSAPYMNGSHNLNGDYIRSLWHNLTRSFASRIEIYKGSVAQFVAASNPNIHLAGRVFFHLVESKQDDYPFAFMATYSSQANGAGASKHLPLKNALVEYADNHVKLLELLATVHKAAENSELVSGLVESGEIFHPIGLTAEEAYSFLKEIPGYEAAGILCRIPKWWRSKSDSLKVTVNIGSKTPSRLTAEALVDFNAQLTLGGEALTPDELRQLMAQAEGLAFLKGKWVEVDHEKLRETLKAYEQAQKLADKSELSILEAMRFQLHAKKVLQVAEEACELEVTNGQWLSSVVNSLLHPETIEPVVFGDDFRASLRAYQERGVSWLHRMKTLGLGACLADDMGLGKTVQVIALLSSIRTAKANREKALLVVPASLIGNWMSEMDKFAPSLSYYVVHPSENKQAGEDGSAILHEHDVFITTYGMLLKYEWLREATWDTLILDEAQAIKNPGTKQTKTVKRLKANYRLAMTGTPIENRLSDLWSLFDFLNKGLLGSPKEFAEFSKSLKERHDGYAQLKKVIGTFTLRRLKTDKTVIADLPDKIEMKSYSTLSKRQAALYQSLVNELKMKLESEAEGIARKGLVLASLMKFKQICNHPDQYLGQSEYAEEESGKYARLREICETIYEKRERVLVFTQFKEMTEPLHRFLEQVFQHKGLVLHGETAVGKRKELVDQFQGDAYVPFMVLSIKAGGVGLNLTSANHVIHFDRWWNPAVENQATDRAFRIGQRKNVIVHKFIAKGTIEEKIDAIIEDKIKLSKELVPDIQENWITEMDNERLMDLFKLSI
jgi:non-specific serine/threonine protein kinase